MEVYKMEVFDLCLLMIFLATKSLAQMAVSTCTATNENTLECLFPEDINALQKDFVLLFYDDRGDDELLVECTWMVRKIWCITQGGFKLRGPVSDNAVITIPTRFSDIKGSYLCIPQGYTLDSMIPCRFPNKQDSNHFSTCEVQAELDSHEVILKCVFSSEVESFRVVYNRFLVAKHTRSSCQSSTVCHNNLEDNNHVFSVRLNTSEIPHSEYICQPDNSLFEVHGCSMAIEKHTEASRAPALSIILSFVCVMCLVSTVWSLSTYA